MLAKDNFGASNLSSGLAKQSETWLGFLCQGSLCDCYNALLAGMEAGLATLTCICRLCRRGDAKDLLTKLLGDPVKIFTTKCVMHELRKLGKEMAGVDGS